MRARVVPAAVTLIAITHAAHGQAEGFPKVKASPAAPGPPNSGTEIQDPKVAARAKSLKARDPKARAKAATDLGAMGETAAEAARPLCDATLDPFPAVARASLLALEQVRPDLYKPVSDLVLDRDGGVHLRAIVAIGGLGEAGQPAVGLVIAKANAELTRARRNNAFSLPATAAALTAIRQMRLADDEAGRYLRSLTAPGLPVNLRLEAGRMLCDWCGDDADRRTAVFPLLRVWVTDPALQVPAIELVAGFGPHAKPFVPQLRVLKLSNTAAVRDAAERALVAVGED